MIPILSRPAAAGNWASGEYATGRRERKVGAILHWMAGYLPGTTAMFQNPATGYATSLGVGSRDGWGNDLQVHRYVPADGYAFGSYNEYADRRGESIEIENDRNLPYPGKPTPAVHELVAQLLAQLCIDEDWPLIDGKRQLVLGDFPDHRYYLRDIPGFGVDFNVTTHRSMALKDCPGSTDVQWIVARGNEILTPPPPPRQEFGMAQRMYFARIREDGTDDGEWMLAGPDIPPHPTDPKQDGYRVTIDKSQALIWARQNSFNPAQTLSVQLTRDAYIAQQEFARRDAAEWRAGMAAIFNPRTESSS